MTMMRGANKTREQLIGELTQMRQKIIELKTLEKELHLLEWTLRELQCLSDIADIAEIPGITADEIYQEAANLIPKSYQYPEITCSKITIDGREFSTDNYRETSWKQSADIEANKATIGKVEVNYLEERPVIDEGPFLKAERLLINAVAERLGQVTARKRLETERRRLEQRAQTMNCLASVGAIASGIAHKINEPLTGVISFTSLLMQKDIPEDIKGDAEIINEGSQQVVNTVNRLLAFASQCKPERVHVDINQIIETTLELRDYEMKTSSIHVITRLDPDLPCTIADGAQLQQAFLNIITNAEMEMKLAHGQGNLFIKTEKIDNTVRISFKDDGPGIAKDDLKRLFDPSFASREVGEGTRLDLSICHGIITEHGGKIYAESVSGKGATVIMELPIVTEPEELKPAEPVADGTESVDEAGILVVGTELPILEFMSRVLTEEGHEVETADNAQYALERLKSKKYSLILLDTQPRENGIGSIELYERIQKIAPSLAKRVAFVTSEVIQADIKDFLTETEAPHIGRPAVKDIARPLAAKQLKEEIHRILAQGA